MKTINLKKIALLLFTVSLVAGCNINAIPTFVSKDVSFGIITVNNLQNERTYAQEITLDLSNFISDDQFDAIDEAKIKSFIFTLNTDYKNTVTNSIDFKGGVAIYKLIDGLPFNITNLYNGSDYRSNIIVATSNFKNNTPQTSFLFDRSFNIKNLIKDKKVKLGIVIFEPALSGTNFNDNAFSFSVKAETEVLVVQ